MRERGYLDLEEVHARVAARGFVVEEIGRSRQGREIIAASIGEGEELTLVVANIHGVEHISAHVALEFAAQIAGGEHAELRERARVVVIPVLNPDGYVRTLDQSGAGPLKELRCNAGGVDLNRNFPLPEGATHTRWPFGGTNDDTKPTYRGIAPGSEPETRALLEFTEGKNVRAIASLHSFMGTLVTPRLAEAEAFAAYNPLCAAFRGAQPVHTYRRMASRFVDGFTGELEDYFHHERDAWSICVETFPVVRSYRQHLRAPNTFWRFNPKEPQWWAKHDAPAIAAYLLAALKTGRPSSLRTSG